MEHSVLHALQLAGLIVVLGGPVLVLGLVWPALQRLGLDAAREEFGQSLADNAARWVFRGALVSALAGCVDFFVQVAEVQGKSVFGGINPGLTIQFATQTTVGNFSLARLTSLLLAAAAARVPGWRKWWGVILFGTAALVFASLVSHAAAQPTNHFPAIAAQIAHMAAAGAWIGVLIHLLASRANLQSACSPADLALTADVVRRFSPVALTASSVLAVSGLLAAVRFLGTPRAALTSAYGLTLIVKLLLLVPVLFAGFVNYRVIRPALLGVAKGRTGVPPLREGEEVEYGDRRDACPTLPKQSHGREEGRVQNVGELLRRFGRMLELEVTAGLLVITVAGIVGSISPPGEDGAYRLTEAQVRAVLSPDWPTTAIVDPATFYGAPMRTVDDLRYSEFTHNWSGVFVCLLGIFWLLQSAGGRLGSVAGRLWPFLLLPFAVFIGLAADPEVWLLRRVSFREALGDPQVLEHQLGALLVLLLVWLGWRDRKRPEPARPLGYALPAIMILGSLLLLGHAHSTLIVTEDLTNLINAQHAVFGALGLFAGTVRWLMLRGLVPQRNGRFVWPALILALGLFMMFVYREVV
jgi:putative copper export protein